MNVKEMQVAELVPYEDNPRKNDQAVDAVAASIKEFGFKVPVIVDRDNVIIAGHTRIKAAKKLGMETVPAVLADDLTPEQARAFRLADNKTAELAEWDLEALERELAELEDFDMERFGFEELRKEAGLDDVQEDDFDEDLPEKPETKLGYIYQLGEHRLMCGDSTDPESLKKLMGGRGLIWSSRIRPTESRSEIKTQCLTLLRAVTAAAPAE